LARLFHFTKSPIQPGCSSSDVPKKQTQSRRVKLEVLGQLQTCLI
jgi:hypothetical protein